MSQSLSNPFLAPYNTPFQVPPFDRVEPEHFLPAFEQGMAEQQESIAAIIQSEAEPTFENTIEALERSGDLLTRVSSVFFNLASANTILKWRHFPKTSRQNCLTTATTFF